MDQQAPEVSSPEQEQARKSKYFGLAACALLFVLAGCGAPTLDGSSPESFKQSVAEVSRTLPEAERAGFMADLAVLAQAEGTERLEEPTLATLVALDGKSPAVVKERATALRKAQRREWLARKLEAATVELEKVAQRMEFMKEYAEAPPSKSGVIPLIAAEEAQRQLRTLYVEHGEKQNQVEALRAQLQQTEAVP